MLYNTVIMMDRYAQPEYTAFAEVYDRLMRDVDYAAWTAYLGALIGDAWGGLAGLRAVDCACGTGAVAIRLAQAGMDVIGVDLSEDMLGVAREKALRAGLRLPFVRQDMCRLSVHKPVHAINCACDGVNYLTREADAERFFRAAHEALLPGGVLLFDISSEYKLAALLGREAYCCQDEDCAYAWTSDYDAKSRLCRMWLSVFVRRKDGAYRRFDEIHVQRAHSIDALRSALERAGFADIRVYDAMTRRAPQEKSERIQFVARREK